MFILQIQRWKFLHKVDFIKMTWYARSLHRKTFFFFLRLVIQNNLTEQKILSFTVFICQLQSFGSSVLHLSQALPFCFVRRPLLYLPQILLMLRISDRRHSQTCLWHLFCLLLQISSCVCVLWMLWAWALRMPRLSLTVRSLWGSAGDKKFDMRWPHCQVMAGASF